MLRFFLRAIPYSFDKIIKSIYLIKGTKQIISRRPQIQKIDQH